MVKLLAKMILVRDESGLPIIYETSIHRFLVIIPYRNEASAIARLVDFGFHDWLPIDTIHHALLRGMMLPPTPIFLTGRWLQAIPNINQPAIPKYWGKKHQLVVV